MTWVTWVDRDLVWNVFLSTAERRLVFLRGGTVEVLAPGEHRVPWLAGIRAVGHVRMTPCAISQPITQELRSSDDVLLQLTTRLTLQVRDERACITRVALDPEAELHALAATLGRELAAICRGRDAQTVRGDANDTLQRAAQQVDWSDSPFELLSASVDSATIGDEVLEGLALAAIHEREEDRQARQQAAARKVQLEEEQQLQRSREEERRQQEAADHTARLEMERAAADQEIEIRKAREKVELELARERAAVAAMPGGLWAIAPDAARQIDMGRLEERLAQLKQFEAFLGKLQPVLHSGGVQAGALEVLKQAVGAQLGITFKNMEPSKLLTEATIGSPSEEGSKEKQSGGDSTAET